MIPASVTVICLGVSSLNVSLITKLFSASPAFVFPELQRFLFCLSFSPSYFVIISLSSVVSRLVVSMSCVASKGLCTSDILSQIYECESAGLFPTSLLHAVIVLPSTMRLWKCSRPAVSHLAYFCFFAIVQVWNISSKGPPDGNILSAVFVL